MAPLRGWVLRDIPVKPYSRGEMKCAECDRASRGGYQPQAPPRRALDHRRDRERACDQGHRLFCEHAGDAERERRRPSIMDPAPEQQCRDQEHQWIGGVRIVSGEGEPVTGLGNDTGQRRYQQRRRQGCCGDAQYGSGRGIEGDLRDAPVGIEIERQPKDDRRHERAIAVDGPPAPGRERRVADELVSFAIGERRLTGRQRRHGQRQREVQRADRRVSQRGVHAWPGRAGESTRRAVPPVGKTVQVAIMAQAQRGFWCCTRGFYTPVAPFRCVRRVALIGL